MFFSNLHRLLAKKLGRTASPEQVRGIAKDTHPEEREHMGLEDYLAGVGSKVSKDALLAHIADKMPYLTLHPSEFTNEEGRIRHRNQSLGSRLSSRAYRNMVYKWDNHAGIPYKNDKHWGGVENPLFHLRTTSRAINEGGEGKAGESLHIEELQSDWHNQLNSIKRRAGEPVAPLTFAPPESPTQEMIDSYPKVFRVLHDAGHTAIPLAFMGAHYSLLHTPQGYAVRGSERESVPGTHASIQDAMLATVKHDQIENQNRISRMGYVAPAPFHNYHELAFRTALHEAAKQGKSHITWSTGEQQNLFNDNQSPDGQEAKKKFYGSIAPETHSETGDEIPGTTVQKHGMIGMYANEYARRLHGTPDAPHVGMATTSIGNEQTTHVHSLAITPQMREKVLREGVPLWGHTDISTKSLALTKFTRRALVMIKGLLKASGVNPEDSVLDPSHLQMVRDSYVTEHGIEKKYRGQVGHDVPTAKRIADAYDTMKHEPENPEVKASYEALCHETEHQYAHLVKHGYRLTPWSGEGEPYANSHEMRQDVLKNKHLHYFPTDNGFGSSGADTSDNPLLKESNVVIGDKRIPYNDLFRGVHDLFGHAVHGYQFGAKGEENAWAHHASMFTEKAVPALTSETRGQNSWVNFGKHIRRTDGTVPKPGDADFLHPTVRRYADQKTGLLPKEFSDESHVTPFRKGVIGDVEDESLWTRQYRARSLKSLLGKNGNSPYAAYDPEKRQLQVSKEAWSQMGNMGNYHGFHEGSNAPSVSSSLRGRMKKERFEPNDVQRQMLPAIHAAENSGNNFIAVSTNRPLSSVVSTTRHERFHQAVNSLARTKGSLFTETANPAAHMIAHYHELSQVPGWGKIEQHLAPRYGNNGDWRNGNRTKTEEGVAHLISGEQTPGLSSDEKSGLLRHVVRDAVMRHGENTAHDLYGRASLDTRRALRAYLAAPDNADTPNLPFTIKRELDAAHRVKSLIIVKAISKVDLPPPVNAAGELLAPASAEHVAAARERGISVPPTVWGLTLSSDPEANIQATWYDRKGRRQSAYHPHAIEERDDKKFGSMAHFSEALPDVRETVRRDLTRPPESVSPVKRASAAIVRLIDHTGMRVGSEQYAKENDTVGASSLRKKNVRFAPDGETLSFAFRGKHGKPWRRTVSDRELHPVIAGLHGGEPQEAHSDTEDVPESAATDTRLFPATEAHVGAYLRPFGVTPKQFRTYYAGRLATRHLLAENPDATPSEREAQISRAVKHVSDFLGNTPAMAKSSYINPAILDAHRKGILDESVALKSVSGAGRLRGVDDTWVQPEGDPRHPHGDLSHGDFAKVLKHLGRLLAEGKISDKG